MKAIFNNGDYKISIDIASTTKISKKEIYEIVAWCEKQRLTAMSTINFVIDDIVLSSIV